MRWCWSSSSCICFCKVWRATLIPAVAVPVSLIGTFAGMYALGFSINTLTLFGMVLAIGMVVDDAIVVVENVERHIEEGLSPKDAAKKAMEEVTGPVIAIVLVLCAVFVPVGFLGGITGQLYKQFAITIAISVIISGFVALTLSPALCALVLKPRHSSRKGFFAYFNRFFGWTQTRYAGGRRQRSSTARSSPWPSLASSAFLALGCSVSSPSGFLPEEDQGYYHHGRSSFRMGRRRNGPIAVMSKVEGLFLSVRRSFGTDALAGQNFVFSTRGT